MICPSCGTQIREESRYLMSRDPNGEMVWSSDARAAALTLVLGLLVLATIAVLHLT